MGQGFPNQRIGINLGAGTGTARTGTVVLSNSNNVTFGMATTTGGSFVITASATNPGVAISAGTAVASTGTVSFSNANGVSFGLNGQTLTASVGYTYPDFENISYHAISNVTNLTALSERPFFIPFHLPYYLAWNRFAWEGSRSTSGSNSFSMTVGIYTLVDSQTMSLLGSFSASFSNTATASVSGIRQFLITGVATAMSALTPGPYVLGLHFHTLGGTASMNYSIRGVSQADGLGAVFQGANNVSTATSQLSTLGYQFNGVYSTTSASLPNSVADSQLFHGLSGSQDPVNAWFRLGRT
jgi:hypothetical protein